MSYKGGDRAEFGIIDEIDPVEDYGDSYEPQKYRCVAICDDAVNDWWDKLAEMKSCFHCLNRSEKNLARWGVTLIPPESIDLLAKVILENTEAQFMSDALQILEIIKQAKARDKFVIHYGI